MNFKHVLTIFLIPLALFGSQESLPKKHQYYDLVAQINGNGKNVSRFIKEELQQNERSLLDEAVKSGALTQNNYDNYFKLSRALWIRNKLKIDKNDNQPEPMAASHFDGLYFKEKHRTILKEQFEKCRIHSPLFYSIAPFFRPMDASARCKLENIHIPQLIENPLTPTIKLSNKVSVGESLLDSPHLPHVLLHEYGHLKKHHTLKQLLFDATTFEKKYSYLTEFEADLFCTRKNSNDIRGFVNYLWTPIPGAINMESDTHPAISERCKRLERAAQLLDAQQDYYKNIATNNPGRAYDEAWLRWCEKQNRRKAKEAILAPYRKRLAQMQKIN